MPSDPFDQLLSQFEDNGWLGVQHGPMEGAERPWREWLPEIAPHLSVDLMAPQHIELWDWIDSLRKDAIVPAFLADWPRGYGKTTTMRYAMARMAVRMERTFGLYVSSTQESANKHITTIRHHFERMGLSRAESKYGHALGWSGEQLRTNNGFTLLALGLDTAAIRGLNLDDNRPDFIVFDDIDELFDSVGNILKKKQTIARTVIPAGSRDCAYLFGQNEIHANSVMHWFVSGEAGVLRNRILSKVVAVEGFACKPVPNPNGGKDLLKITAGTSTWAGKTLAEWEVDLNKMDEDAFRAECLHELGAGGLFFDFQATKVDVNTGEVLDWHVCPMPKYEHWWEAGAGHDYGTAAPACSLIRVVDPWGVVTVIGEEYAADRTSKQQALGLMLKCWELGIGSRPPARRVKYIEGEYGEEYVPGEIVSDDEDGNEESVNCGLELIAFDYANTFVPLGDGAQTATQRMGEYPVEVWHRYGLPAVRAVKDVIAGLRGMVNWLGRTVTYPMDHPTQPGETVPGFRIARGAAPMFQGYLETAAKHPKDERLAVAPPKYEHAGDAGRMMLATRPEAADKPPPSKQRPKMPYSLGIADQYETIDDLPDHIKKELGIQSKQRRF